MATKDILPDAQVPISKCKVCDRGVDARFYCQECTQEMCKDCQRRHLRMTSCRNHTIIRIAADKDTSVHQKESSNITCQTHPKETVQMYCLTCRLPVCHKCLAEKSHKNHDLDELDNIAEKYKKKLAEFIKETKQDISNYQTSLQSIQNNIQDYNKLADKTISDINQQRQQIKSEADKVADDMILKVEQRKLQDVNTMKEEGDKVKNIISDDKELLRPCEEKLQSDIDTSVKDFKTVSSLNKKKSSFSMTPLRPPVFVRNDVHGLQDIFGSLDDQKVGPASGRRYNPDEEPTQRPGYKPKPAGGRRYNPDEESTQRPEYKPKPAGGRRYNPDEEPTQRPGYKPKPAGGRRYNPDEKPTQRPGYKPKPAGISVNISTDVVSHINPGIRSYVVCAVSDKEAWCGGRLGIGEDLVLVQSDGTVKKRVKLDHYVYDITVTMSGDLLYTESGRSTIRQYSPDKVTVISNTGSHYTQSICTTSQQQLLVCLCNSKNDNKVVRMSLNGHINQTIQYNKQNKPLFSYPRLVTENINEDICVVDDDSTVVVVNQDGEFRFKYPESDKSTHTIKCCCGIACDKLGYILISDYGNSRVHLIDIDGKFVKLVLTDQNSISYPWGLSIDHKGQLWVCNKSNGCELTVYKYRS